MSNISESKVTETAAATSFCIEDQGETEREKKRICWQRIRSAFYHCFENITDCFDFWFCKNECCDFCCTCDDYYHDDENERYGVAPALIRSEHNLEVLAEKGISNEAVNTENEVEIHAISLDCGGGDGDFKGGNSSEKHSVVEQSNGGQHNDHEVCVIEGGGDAEHRLRSLKENNSGDLQLCEGHPSDHGVREFRDGSDLGIHSAGHHPSVGHYTNHGASDSGNDSGGHHTSGGDYAVSDFRGGGDSGGGAGMEIIS